MNKKLFNKKTITLFVMIAVLQTTACGKYYYFENYTEDVFETEMLIDSFDRFTYLHEGNSRLCTNYEGIFYISNSDASGKIQNDKIWYYDYSTGNSGVWCSNVSCNHDSRECAAYVNSDYIYVEWSDGYIYKVDSDDSGIYLMRYNQDGTGETKIVNLLDGISGNVEINFGRVYNNKFFYCLTDDENKYNFYCAFLNENNNKEYLFSLDKSSNSVSMSGFFINDNCIYVSSAQYMAENYKYKRVVYLYSFYNKEVREVVSRDDYYRTCANDYLYFFTQSKELFKVREGGFIEEISPGKFKEINDGQYGIYCNENYIVIIEDFSEKYFWNSNSRMIYIYNIAEDILKGISIGEIRANNGVSTDICASVSEGVQYDDNYLQSGSAMDFVSKNGLTGNYCILYSDIDNRYYFIDLESVLKENVKTYFVEIQ